jgi:hypothetical protein
MAYSPSELSEQDFMHSYLAEYLDGDLSPELRARFEKTLQSPGQTLVPEHFQAMRGRLQLGLQSYYLKEGEIQALRALVQDPAVTATKENLKIDQLGRKVIINTIMRRAVLIGIAAALIGLIIWRLAPEPEQTFKPLEYLGYEALAMEEDPEGRLDLPSSDPKEISDYLYAYPGLDFKPRILKDFDKGWKLDGGTVIDYEIARVATVQYSNKKLNEQLIHFSYKGQLSDLPKSEAASFKGLVYQTYSSDQLNLIAWQHGEDVVSLLVGRRGALELAEIAVLGGGTKN